MAAQFAFPFRPQRRARTGRSAAALALLLVGAALTAPPASAQMEPAAPVEMAALAPQAVKGLETVRVRPGISLAAYDRVLLAPIALAVERDRHDLILSERDREHAQEYFREKLVERLGPDTITTQRGPRTLVMQITLTEFKANSPAMPRRPFGGFISDVIGVGEAAFEAVLRDSQTGDVVAVIADRDVGQPLPQNMRAHTQYGDANAFMRRWARQIADLLTGESAAG